MKTERALWIFDHHAVPPSISGFVRHHHHAQYIRGRGWDTRIITSSYNHKTHRYERPVKPWSPVNNLVEEGVDFSWIYTTPYTSNNWRRYVNYATFLAMSQISTFGSGRPDAVMGSSPHLLAALAGWITARRFRVPFILEVQDLWPESLVQLGLKNKAIIRSLEVLESFLYKRADAIVTLSDGISDGVIKKSSDAKRVVLIPNGAIVGDPVTPEQRAERRRTLGWDDKFVAIWTGAHGKANHLDTIVQAARTVSKQAGHQNILFVLVGDGPEKHRLVDLGHDIPNLQFHDPVPGSEVPLLLKLADVGVIVHSDSEAVRGVRPTKLSEYMAAGLPIISNMQGEPARLIEQGQCGVTVPTMRPDLLAAAVIDASSRPALLRNQGARGMDFVRQTHNRKLLSGKLAALLNEVVQEW